MGLKHINVNFHNEIKYQDRSNGAQGASATFLEDIGGKTGRKLDRQHTQS